MNKSGVFKVSDTFKPFAEKFPGRMAVLKRRFLLGRANEAVEKARMVYMRPGKPAMRATKTRKYRAPFPKPITSILTKRHYGTGGLAGAITANVKEVKAGIAIIHISDQKATGKTNPSKCGAILASIRRAWDPVHRGGEWARINGAKLWHDMLKRAFQKG